MMARFAWLFMIPACGSGSGDGIDADGSAAEDARDADVNVLDADDAPGGIGEPTELAGMTLYHNQVRASISTTPPIPALVWSEALEATAAAWAAQCIDVEPIIGLIDHNPNRSVGHPYYVGENIYGGGIKPNAQQVVTKWASEASSYDYASNTCNGVCGHYTQVVWRETREIGCAIHDCANLAYRWSVVCDYGPGGNDGSRPY